MISCSSSRNKFINYKIGNCANVNVSITLFDVTKNSFEVNEMIIKSDKTEIMSENNSWNLYLIKVHGPVNPPYQY